MALAEAIMDATDARLAALDLPPFSGWAGPARRAALARVRAMGLPMRRDEYWRFTRPDLLVALHPQPAYVLEHDEAPLFDAIDCLKIVFVDGIYSPEASDNLVTEGVTVERLADVADRDIHWASDIYGVLEAKGQNPVNRPLAALNTTAANDGVLIRVASKVNRPISLIYVHASECSDAILHHVVKVEAGADVTVLENGPAAARFNTVIEVDLAEGGTFHHIRAQGRDHKRLAATHIFARLARESVFKSFTLCVNGALTRNEAVIDIQGDFATAHIAGAAVGDGDFHHDDTVFVIHDAVGCESRQVFKKVLRNGATGVFQGKILVKPGAQKTDGYQISQSLLLDEDCVFLAKPELEIYADDVVCSHGSTSGAIDESAMFYLRSRGIGQAAAQDLLVLAFLAQAIDEVESPEISGEILRVLTGWLERRR